MWQIVDSISLTAQKMMNSIQILAMLPWFTAFFLLFAFLYYVFKIQRRFQRFKKYNIKGPSPNFLLGNLLELESKPRYEIFDDWFEKYGETFCYHSPSRSTIVTEDLSLIKQVFSDSRVFDRRPFLNIQIYPLMHSALETSGKSWSNPRRAVSPILSSSKVHSSPISEILDDCVERFLRELNPSKTHEMFKREIIYLCNCYSFDIILKTSLGMDMDVYSDDQLMRVVDTFFDYSNRSVVKILQYLPFWSLPVKIISENVTCGEMIDIVMRHLKKTIHDHLTTQARIGSNAVILQSMLQHLKNGNITEHQLLGNILIMILAGYETTANGIIYCLYMLAKYPDIQDKMRHHVRKDGYEHPYVEMVWFETLRIYPPGIGVMSREASRDTVINGMVIEKHTCIMADIWRIHHSPKYWKDSWKFDPTRFDHENRLKITSCSFLPYGYGPRTCLGMNLGTAAACRLMAKIVSQYKVTFCDSTPDPLPIGNTVPELTKPIGLIPLEFKLLEDL